MPRTILLLSCLLVSQLSLALTSGAPTDISVSETGDTRWGLIILLMVGGLLLGGLLMYAFLCFRKRRAARRKDSTGEQERRQTLELMQNRMDLLTNIAHEFKTPLSMIIGPVSHLLATTKDEKLQHQLQGIYDNAVTLNTLVHNSLEMGRTAWGTEQVLIRSQFEMVGFCRNIVEQHAAANPHLSFLFDTSVESLPFEGDVVKMECILNNLLSNASKYLGEGSHIVLSLSVEQTAVDAAADGQMQALASHLILRLSDDGPGISAHDLPFVFNRLYQTPRSDKTVEDSGIGLHMVKTFVELHDGRIMVDSTEENGATFTIVLPIVTVDDTPVTVPMSPAASDQRPRILIVEDNAMLSDFLAEVVGEHYQTQQATNGKEGLAYASALLPDLIITDAMMPVMNGMDMCHLIRQNAATRTTPIIMLTAKDDPGTEKKSILTGIDCFMPKPFDTPLLLARIGQLLESSKAHHSRARIEAIAEAHTEAPAASPDDRLFREITGFIEENLSDPELNVAFVCQELGVTNKTLYRLLKRQTDRTPVEYIRQLRIAKAAILLTQGRFSVSEVMYMVGFTSSGYFARCFQLQYGCSPRQYAKREDTKTT